MFAIETDSLTKRFGARIGVFDLALRVPTGSIYGFLGPNGAGKTTTMRLLLGLLRPDAGDVRLLGRSLARERRGALSGVGAFVESPSLYDHLSGETNLDMTRRLLGLPKREVARVLEIVGLRAAASRRVGGYSLGMKQRLALARALLGTPQLLLLDEPTNGLDPDGIIAMRDLVQSLPDRVGATVFVSSHLLAEVERVATVVGLMRGGRLVLQAEIGALQAGGRRVRIELDDAARGVAVLQGLGMEAVAAGAGALHLHCPGADQVAVLTSRANVALVGAGIAVFALVPEPWTLEQVYRESEALAA
ncbi:MAG: ATP-binding cassette domain-containing protein [Sphingomonas sp.]|jgi:lantibiotic transport system ATP-binding protein|uniref:ATP-binding cassette domain-containing protein n=1 Tax=Sphingomonas sp. TaxID=28214 RepID=UPI0025F92725|nr:ATP-binding cassette domain-containing protein [Sphingomonas sp.]MBX9883047.1 ATP-binding cassette domain-containing protein [Sphingomonas sp.]